ncbi:sugar transferase, partial [Thermus sp.]
SESNGPRFAQVGDARVTRVGAILRKYRLDEIPQLWNVIKGDMSLIGPRPEQEAFAKQFAREIPFFETRHFVRPGLTGWAQVVHGYTSDHSGAKEKLAYDLYYVKNFSFWLDLLIIIKTVSVIFRGFGAR